MNDIYFADPYFANKWDIDLYNNKVEKKFTMTKNQLMDLLNGKTFLYTEGQKVVGRAFPTKVIFNAPATIVYWDDDTKTVVQAHDEPFDPEKGLAMAFMKKYCGNKGNFNDYFRQFLPKED